MEVYDFKENITESDDFVKKLAVAVAVLLCLTLSACSSYGGNSNIQKREADSKATNSVNSTQTCSSVMLSNMWNGNSGVYSVWPYWMSTPVGTNIGNENYSLIHFFDYSTLNSIILCNKPNCRHNVDSCNAYFATTTKAENTIALFGLSNTIYALTNDGILYSMHEDGTDRQKVLTVPSKYIQGNLTSVNAYLVRNRVYLQTSFYKEASPNSNDNLGSNANTRYTGLLELDVSNKTCQLIYSYPSLNGENWLGIVNGKALFFQQDEFQATAKTQKDYDAQENSRKTKIYTRDLKDGVETVLFSGLSKNYDSIIFRGQSIYYQDRKSGKIIRYDFSSGKTKELVKNLYTYITFWDMNVIDNRLVYRVRYSDADINHKTLSDDVDFEFDIDTGNVKKINYTTHMSAGGSRPLTRFTLVTKDSFVIPTQFKQNNSSVVSKQYGIIKKSDFWNGNFAAIKPIAWTGDNLRSQSS